MKKVQMIAIEAGHHRNWLGRNTGARGNGIDERDYVVALSGAVMGILSEKEECKDVLIHGVGVQTNLTLDKKIDNLNWLRAENGYDPKGCLILSLHLNSFSNSNPHGYEIYYKTDKNGIPKKTAKDLAGSIAHAFDKYKIISPRSNPVRPAHRTRAQYINYFWGYSVLVECGFLSNFNDAKQLKENMPKIAESIAHGILNYIRNN